MKLYFKDLIFHLNEDEENVLKRIGKIRSLLGDKESLLYRASEVYKNALINNIDSSSNFILHINIPDQELQNMKQAPLTLIKL